MLYMNCILPYPVFFFVSVVGISNFAIRVGDIFDGNSFNPDDFSECTKFEGYPKHGNVSNIFSCDSPQTGRYVAIYASYGTAESPFNICEVEVHTRSGKVLFISAANTGNMHSLGRPTGCKEPERKTGLLCGLLLYNKTELDLAF